MKIKYNEEPKKTRPCTFADVPVGGVLKADAGFIIALKLDDERAIGLNLNYTVLKYEEDEGVTFYPEPVTHQLDCAVELGRAVTEVPCD